ncbi:molybdate ABC transporter substrate-binding protein [Acidobacteriota bacterium]
MRVKTFTKRKQRSELLMVLGILLTFAHCFSGDTQKPAQTPGKEIVLFAAASTTDVMTGVAKYYETLTGVGIKCNFAASSTLAQQILAGAEFDVYVSANTHWMDYLEQRSLIDKRSRHDLLGNSLVLIAPRGGRFKVEMTPDFPIASVIEGRIALGDWNHVPAGMYAKHALENLGWWQDLEERMVPSRDVRSALRLVELGETAAGIVYATDAAVTDKVEVITAFPPEYSVPIVYPAALRPQAAEEARAFHAFLQGKLAAPFFRDAGFVVLDKRK